MLTSRTSGPVSIDPDIGLLDLDLGDIVHFRDDIHRGERSMAPLVGIKG